MIDSMTQRLDIIHLPETSEALWQLCRSFAAVYNSAIAELREVPTTPLETTQDSIGLYTMLGEWRENESHPSAHLPMAACRAAVAHAHATQQAWSTLQIQDPQAAEETGPPSFLRKKDIDRNAENCCIFDADVYCVDRIVVLPGGLSVSTVQNIIDAKSVFACQIVERTSKEFTMERRCDPKDRSFTIELQRYE